MPFSKKDIKPCKQPFPLWLNEEVERRHQKSQWSLFEKEAFVENIFYKPLLFIRCNFPGKEQEKKMLRDISENGYTLEKQKTWGGYSIKGKLSVFSLSSFRLGFFEIQDLASQKIGEALDVHRGMMVWDTCAGGGGKTLQIASRLQGRGRVYGSDIREWKLKEIKKRAKKAGFSNVSVFYWDAEKQFILTKEVEKRGGFHRILVDAPCSGSGTIRRNPDVIYRMDKNQISELNILQSKLLKNSSKYLRSNGILVYATCSFLVSENEKIVDAFLFENRDFELIEYGIQGSPYENSDTMFIAKIKKRVLP